MTERSTRYAERLVNQESVDDGAQLRFDSIPVHERITVHESARAARRPFIDKLADSRRSLLDRGTGLNDGLIDGRVTLHVLLRTSGSAIRSTTRTPSTSRPDQRTRLQRLVSTQWSVPVRQFRLRVLNAENRPLHVRDLGKLGEPQIRRSGGWIERTWDARDVVALPNESRPQLAHDVPAHRARGVSRTGRCARLGRAAVVVAPGDDAQLSR